MSLYMLHELDLLGETAEAPPKRKPCPANLLSARRAIPSAYFRWQELRSRVLAALLLIPALPIIGLLVVIVRLTSPGPGLFRQTRVGLHGRQFLMYKLRTMRNDAEAQTGPVWAQPNDPRVTPVGRIFRRLHLDEFPQLFNVLRGEMALVGPRPERPQFVQVLATTIPHYLDRLAVRPGITGLAQINLPPDIDLDCVRRKLVLDLEYVEHANVLVDLRILAVTGLRLWHVPTDMALRWLRLTRKAPLDTDLADAEPALPSIHGERSAAQA